MCEGDSSQWADLFPDGLVPKIIDLICQAWAGTRLMKSDRLEVPITRKLHSSLLRLKGQRKGPNRLPFTIWVESSEIDPTSDTEKGRIDIRFLHGHREEVYFAVECKRLNVRNKKKLSTLASEYVNEGMMRFITGKYAEGLDKGCMLAYVMNGQIPAAIESVRRAVEAERVSLAMTPDATLTASATRPGLDTVKESKHSLAPVPMLLYHIFVAAG
jgi:hypothetical protein